jgi:hypothetical protein
VRGYTKEGLEVDVDVEGCSSCACSTVNLIKQRLTDFLTRPSPASSSTLTPTPR